ncbi:MAG: hypothetical protein ACM3JH_00765 [Acidithiobacillales bacterium]
MSARRNDTVRRKLSTPVDFRVASEEAEREWLNTIFTSFVQKSEEPRTLVQRMVQRRWIARQRDERRRGH